MRRRAQESHRIIAGFVDASIRSLFDLPQLQHTSAYSRFAIVNSNMSFLNDGERRLASFAYSLPNLRAQVARSGHRKAPAWSLETGEFTSAMVNNRPAILIAEDQIFIALEAERILSEAFDCTIEICRLDRLAAVLTEKTFHVVILDLSGNPTENLQYVLFARQTGAEVVFLTANNDLAHLPQAFSDVPLITKPFNERQVLGVVGCLMSRRLLT